MIKILVFSLVIASTLRQNQCNTTKSTEKIKEDSKELLKKEKEDNAKAPLDEVSSSAENLTYVASNETESSKDGRETLRGFQYGMGNGDVIPRTSPKLPFPLVTMDSKSHNKTAELIKMVNSAKVVSLKGRVMKPHRIKVPNTNRGKAKQEHIFKDLSLKRHGTLYFFPSYSMGTMNHQAHSKTAELIRTINERKVKREPHNYVFKNKQDIENNVHKGERRYIIRNYDVIEAYINNRRNSKRRSLSRKSNILNEDSSESSTDEDKPKRADENVQIRAIHYKVNYDDRDDDYIVATKKSNVWDYEHEDWAAVTKKVNWDDVHSSRDTSNESKETLNREAKKLKINSQHQHKKNKLKAKDDPAAKHKSKAEVNQKDKVVTEDCDDKDIIVKVITVVNDNDKENGKSEKDSKKILKSQKDEKKAKKHHSKQSERNSEVLNHKKKRPKEKRRHQDQAEIEKEADGLDVDNNDEDEDKRRDARFNKTPSKDTSGTIRDRPSEPKHKNKKEIFDNADPPEHSSKKHRTEKLNGIENSYDGTKKLNKSKKPHKEEYNDEPDKLKNTKISEGLNVEERKERHLKQEGLNIRSKENTNYRNGDKFKEHTDTKHGDENFKKRSDAQHDDDEFSQKEKVTKDKTYDDYKDSYDYHSNKKKSHNDDDIKMDDDYKNQKDAMSHKGRGTDLGRSSRESNKDRWSNKHDDRDVKMKTKPKYPDYKDDSDKDYEMPKNKAKSSRLDDDYNTKDTRQRHKIDDYGEDKKQSYKDYKDSRETKPREGLNKDSRERDEFSRKPVNKNNKEEQWDRHANNNWDKVGVDTNTDSKKETTHRTTPRYKDDIDYPTRDRDRERDRDYDSKPSKPEVENKQSTWNENENNDWDLVGVDKPSKSRQENRYNQDRSFQQERPSYKENRPYRENRPLGRENKNYNSNSKTGERGANPFSRTMLPFKERKSVYDD